MKNKVVKFVAKKFKNKLNTSETDILIKSAATASIYAIRESKALGLTIKSISEKKIIERLPNGKINIIRNLTESISNNGLKKGMVLYRK